MTCPSCTGVGLIRVLRTITRLYGAPRQMQYTKPCPKCHGTGRVSEPLDRNYSASDIAEETLTRMREDCEQFQSANEDLLEGYYAELPASEWGPVAQGGHDFWLSRNGHGAGFFNRGVSQDIADELQDKGRAYREFDLYVGDDGLVYGD